jgi:hypothetical protein
MSNNNIIKESDGKVNNSKELDPTSDDYTCEHIDQYFKELRNKPYCHPASSDDINNYSKNLIEKMLIASEAFFLAYDVCSRCNIGERLRFVCMNNLKSCLNEFNMIVDELNQIAVAKEILIDSMEVK